MNIKYLDTLEFYKIIDILKNYCKTYIGKENLTGLLPSFDKDIVSRLLNETSEAVNLQVKKSNLPLDSIPDIRLWVKQLESFSTLSIKALLEVTSILRTSRELKEYFYSDENINTTLLLEYFSNLYINKGVEDKILSVILDENTLSDHASSKLYSIRKHMKKLEQDIRDKLNSFIHSSAHSKYIMEPIVTIRNNRFVIPIKEEYKNTVKGFVHDISSSGSTVFIEPLFVFDMNNDIANLKAEESIEIETILQNLSSLLYEYVDNIQMDMALIGKLDLIFAKARYSIDTDGTLPIISDNKYLNLMQARHPLITKNTVVPIDVSIGDTYTSLVITGPNTGGKTVTLKTVGLVLLMSYIGIFVPCKENSTIHVFDGIFADIGDEQSIEGSLSTFSSHMSTIVEITHTATSNSLILLDELGSGTDPVEGANLAISILKYFYDLGVIIISTTHYQELKYYCLVTPGFENASSEFNIEKLEPTYKLLVGIPGKSNAFAISKKLGLNDNILNYAKSLMKDENISIEELMKNIYDDKIEIEKEKEKIQKNSNQIELLRKALEKENIDVQTHEKEVIEKAKIEARNLVLSAKEDVSEIIRSIQQLETELEAELEASYKAESLRKANQLRNKLNSKMHDIEGAGDNGNNGGNSGRLNLEVLKSLNSRNRMAHKAGIGAETDKIAKTSNNGNKTNNSSSTVTFTKNNNSKTKKISSEINVIGLNVDEATFVIDKYIDDCAIAKLSPIRIIHGKGTGKLRQGIHAHLKTNSHVKSFRIGTFGEGEMGVTVVELK